MYRYNTIRYKYLHLNFETYTLSLAETWRRVWGTENFCGPRFLNDFSRKKFPFSRQKFMMTLPILGIDQVFRIFPFFSPPIYDPFLTRKTPFFTLFILSRASDNTTSQNIGGTDAWAVPHLKFWGVVSP